MEKEKQPQQETDAEKLARVEQALTEKDNTIAELTAQNESLQKKINSLKIDGLVKKVEPTKEVIEEDVQFDFDM